MSLDVSSNAFCIRISTNGIIIIAKVIDTLKRLLLNPNKKTSIEQFTMPF